jgi:hypothetical protein
MLIEDKTLQDKVLGIYFRTSYMGFGENTQEDIAFIQQNKFKVFIDEKSMNNGYSMDKDKIKELKFLYPYTLKSMSVGRSSSTIELEEYPGKNFNSVNFKFAKMDG